MPVLDSYSYKCKIWLFQQILWILMNIDFKHNLESTDPDGLICESCQENIGEMVRDGGQVSRVWGLSLTVSSGSGPCLQFWVVFVTPLGVVAVGPAVATFWNIGKRRSKTSIGSKCLFPTWICHSTKFFSRHPSSFVLWFLFHQHTSSWPIILNQS